MNLMINGIITIWYRFYDGVYEHNHIEDGCDENQQIPKACTKQQENCWKKINWKKVKGELRNGKVFKCEE